MSEAGAVVVFAGPCRPRAADKALAALLGRPEVTLRPPAARGDVLNVLGSRPRALVILDGLYYSVPAVTHKELLYALDEGVRVLGASSMGALRAAELERWGMEGYGEVYALYRSGEIDGDDEVAVLHGTAETEFRAVSVALVEVRSALRRLLEEGRASSQGAAALIEALSALPFIERRSERIEALAAEALTPGVAAELLAELSSSSAKRRDAVLAVEAALGAPTAREVREAREPVAVRPTIFLHRFFEDHLLGGSQEGIPIGPRRVDAWRVAQALHPEAPRFVRRFRRRLLLASAAASAGASPPQSEIRALGARWAADLEALPDVAPLPRTELETEARIALLAASFEPAAGEEVALPRQPDVAGLGRESVTEWSWARSFALTPAAEPALAVARAAAEIDDCFVEWAAQQRIRRSSLSRLAAEIWSCGLEEVGRAGEARALHGEDVFRVLEPLAAAERLRQPINDYGEARRRLVATSLELPPIAASKQEAARVPSSPW